MNEISNLYEKLRTFFYATLIPICLIEDEKIIFSEPETIEYLPSIIDNKFNIVNYTNFSSSSYQNKKTFYYRNEFDECYALVMINGSCQCQRQRLLIIGPVLNESPSDNQINNIIRVHKLPLKLKAKLSKHYSTLPRIDNSQFYNIGRLAQHIFFEEEAKNNIVPLDNNTFLPEEYFSKPPNDEASIFHHPPYFLEQDLLLKIKNGNLIASIQILKEINSLKRTQLSKDTLRSIKNSLICSITLFTRASIAGGVIPEIAFNLSDFMILEIEKTDNVLKLVDFEYKALEQYIHLVEEISSKTYSMTIKKALSFINKNLTNKLTLVNISSAIFVHPNYLSSLFKKEVGLSLSDYISKARVDESKYYIQYTNTKISDIASFYHFCNQSYYTNAFKKFTGKTPHEYRTHLSHE